MVNGWFLWWTPDLIFYLSKNKVNKIPTCFQHCQHIFSLAESDNRIQQKLHNKLFIVMVWIICNNPPNKRHSVLDKVHTDLPNVFQNQKSNWAFYHILLILMLHASPKFWQYRVLRQVLQLLKVYLKKRKTTLLWRKKTIVKYLQWWNHSPLVFE